MKIEILLLLVFAYTLHAKLLSVDVKISHDQIKVYDTTGTKLFLHAQKNALTSAYNPKKLDIQTNIIKQKSGFDLLFTITNKTASYQDMVDFFIPGIYLENRDTLNILSTNTHLYMQKRDINQIKHSKSYFTIGSLIRKRKDGTFVEDECYYGADTFTPYAPVIVASDAKIAVGSALMYPFLEYADQEKTYTGKHHVLKNKFYPKMRIYKDTKTWRYAYIFPKTLPLKSQIPPHQSLSFILPVRFSRAENFIETLHPYKRFLRKMYGVNRYLKKDLSPILTVNFAFYGSVTDSNARGWAWGLEKIDQNGQSHLPLHEVSVALSDIMRQKGYRRIMFAAFSGVYDTRVCPKMDEELPFQILSNLEPNMQQSLQKSMSIFTKRDQKVELWWGIAGMMPLDSKGKLLSLNKWQACDDRPFLPENPEEKNYALHQLKLSQEHHIDTLILDAYTRMEEKRAFYWLKQMQEFAPDTNFALEMELDIMHTQAAITLQPENELFDDIDLKAAKITKPPILATYLNPQAEVRVWLQHEALGKGQKKYVKKLMQMGYTPMVIMPDSPLLNHDENDVSKRILAHPEVFMDVP